MLGCETRDAARASREEAPGAVSTVAARGEHHLERDAAPRDGVLGLVDGTHAAGAEHAPQGVAACDDRAHARGRVIGRVGEGPAARRGASTLRVPAIGHGLYPQRAPRHIPSDTAAPPPGTRRASGRTTASAPRWRR